MAYKNKTISNPITKQHIRFLKTARDTNGEFLEMEAFYEANSKEPVAHYHPSQKEDFVVQEGQLTVKLDGRLKVLHAGETLHIPAGVVHSMWNSSCCKTIVHWKVTPAMETEYLLETGAGLASDGKTGKNGMPGILQVALTATKFNAVYRVPKPSYVVQRVIFGVLSPLARVLGYRGSYSKHID
ncbi:MAG: cupin domain-containing protein [Gemmatimonadaceae bacterium]|nr:cupin domain-containing protein [Chitinophagaceae bacterium]